MKLYIEGVEAVLMADQSVELVFENRLFSDSDGWSLGIVLPVEKNRRIFGLVDVPEVDPLRLRFDATLYAGSKVYSGCVAVTDISDSEIEVQFLEGRSAANFEDPLDDIYINELVLGYPETSIQPYDGPNIYRLWDFQYHDIRREAVALPWENNTTGVVHNEVIRLETADSYEFSQEARESGKLSWMPYLIAVVRRIADAIGYTADLTEWDNSPMAALLLCNTLPQAWDLPDFGRALPHWTVNELFSNLEPVLRGEFDTDHSTKTIRFRFTAARLAALPPVVISDVCDDFSQAVDSTEHVAGYKGYKTIRYEDRGDVDWKFCDCPWFVRQWPKYRVMEFTSYQALQAHVAALTASRYGAEGNTTIYHVVSTDWPDAWYIIEKYRVRNMQSGGDWSYSYGNRIVRINAFGPWIPEALSDLDDDDREEMTLKCVPVRISPYSGNIMLDVAAYDEPRQLEEDPDPTATEDEEFSGYIPGAMIRAGEPETAAYFDKLHLAFWPQFDSVSLRNYGLTPITDGTRSGRGYSVYFQDYSLAIDGTACLGIQDLKDIDARRKFSFSFINGRRSVPDVRARWIIRGKEYVCAKLTCSVSPENGLSELVRGEFYAVTE